MSVKGDKSRVSDRARYGRNWDYYERARGRKGTWAHVEYTGPLTPEDIRKVKEDCDARGKDAQEGVAK